MEYALRPKGGFRRDFNFFGRVFRWSAWSFSFPFISQVPISGQTLFTGEGSFTTFAELSFKTRFPFCACVADVSVSTRSTFSALRLTLSVVHATQALQKLSQSEGNLGKKWHTHLLVSVGFFTLGLTSAIPNATQVCMELSQCSGFSFCEHSTSGVALGRNSGLTFLRPPARRAALRPHP